MGPFCDGPAPQHRTAAEDQHHDDDDRASLEGAGNGPLGRRLDWMARSQGDNVEESWA
jgi:hypothetical protein